MKQPLVSISCLTYNHAPYIRQCLDGFLMQQCNFDYEILIHDDASTDGTQEIIKEYQLKYPQIVKPILQTENQWRQGVRGISFRMNFPRAVGKYIAMCEGDDYWTDPLKLQKQVDYLENEPAVSLVCGGFIKDTGTAAEKIIKNGNGVNEYEDANGFLFELNDTQKTWLTKTLTCMFRNSDSVFKKFPAYKHTRDVHLYYHLLKIGKGYYFKKVFGVYHVHEGGVFSLTGESRKLSGHYNVYRELFIANNDEFTRKMYFNILLKIIRSNRSKRQVSDYKTSDLTREAIRLIKKRSEIVRLLKSFVPDSIVTVLLKSSRGRKQVYRAKVH